MNKKLIFSLFLVIMGIELVQGAGKLSWFYLTYGVDMEYWIDADRQIRQIDEITNYSVSDERPKTFQTLKAGGLYSFNKLIGIYFELPFYYNRVEPYQSEILAPGQKTDVQDIFALGDVSLGINVKPLEVLSATLLVKLPSYPLQGSIASVREPGAPWAGLGVLQLGLQISAKLKKHFLYATSDIVVFDPFESDNQIWVLPGDLSLFSQYVYEIKLFHSLQLKPWVYLSYSSYHWLGPSSPPDRRMNLGPGLSFSLWLKNNSEISLSVFWTLFGIKQRGEMSIPSTRSVSLGLYYGVYR